MTERCYIYWTTQVREWHQLDEITHRIHRVQDTCGSHTSAAAGDDVSCLNSVEVSFKLAESNQACVKLEGATGP